MNVKRMLANATPYVVSGLMMLGVSKNTSAQNHDNLVAHNTKPTLDIEKLQMYSSWTNQAENLLNQLSEKPLTVGDFNLDNYKFSDIDLHDMFSSEQNDKLVQKAKASPIKRRTKKYLCYGGVKKILRNAGISLGDMQNQNSAYMAANTLAAHPDFIEIKCDIKDIFDLPDGTIIVWGKTRSKPHGHIDVKDGIYGRCDARYTLQSSLDKVTSGRYTTPRFFVLKSMELGLETTGKLIRSNYLRSDVLNSIAEQARIHPEELSDILLISADSCKTFYLTPEHMKLMDKKNPKIEEFFGISKSDTIKFENGKKTLGALEQKNSVKNTPVPEKHPVYAAKGFDSNNSKLLQEFQYKEFIVQGNRRSKYQNINVRS
ncbi:hypothetical protein LJC18_05550 [Lachnospiraceae bacterium OttesenSCG-928-E19]|nr:hypothetical protein [Lachnospiraceae bacterium OttesenSCG-928-E19]